MYDDALGNIQKTSTSVDILKNLTYPIKQKKLTDLEEMILKIRNLAKDDALRSDTEEVVIDSGGYLGRALEESGEYSPEQLKITHNKILFTDDAFDTVKTVIGKLPMQDGETVKYGVNAEVLIGDLIMGGQLVIRTENNSFVVDSNGVTMDFFSNSSGEDINTTNVYSSIAYTNDTSRCIRVVDGNIILNAYNSADAIKISNDCIRLYGEVDATGTENTHIWEPNEAAYIAKDSLNITNARIFNQLHFRSNDSADNDAEETYSWILFPRSNGNLSLKWTGRTDINEN